ncbi:MAG: serine hydrolase [Angelakisella sp.]
MRVKNNQYNTYLSKFDEVFQNLIKSKYIHECSIHIEDADGDFTYFSGHGGRTVDSPMILTSVSKLFTTTCILNLVEQGKLSFEDKLSKFFASDILGEIHIFKGKDYSYDLTVEHLLFQTTGFPDVFAVGKNNLNTQLCKGDITVSFDEYVRIAKECKKKFAPGTRGKAHYSDLNFEMLGKIIEQLENSSLHDAYKKYIFIPLELKNTYLPENDSYFVPNIYYKDNALYEPNTIRSLPACGGLVSTSRETMRFLKAFFDGGLFDKEIFTQLRKFATIQYAPPLGQYGGGFVRLNISGIGNLFRATGELIGHMGASGTYAYYYPEKGIYFVGDVNQLASVAKVFTIPVQLANIVTD